MVIALFRSATNPNARAVERVVSVEEANPALSGFARSSLRLIGMTDYLPPTARLPSPRLKDETGNQGDENQRADHCLTHGCQPSASRASRWLASNRLAMRSRSPASCSGVTADRLTFTSSGCGASSQEPKR